MNNWKTATCEINKINISYTRTGGDKPPLILLHGLIANGSCWSPVASALEEDYDVIMPDARGHGDSSKPAVGYRYENHADDVVGLIEALGLASPILVGHSMGGMIAAIVACRLQGLLNGLILADPSFLSPKVQREVYESDVAEQHQQFLNKSLDEILVQARNKSPHRTVDILQLLARARHQTSMDALQVLAPPNPDYTQLISAIDIPSLLVIAERGVVSLSVAEELQRLNARLHIEKMDGVGHGLHYDEPERFVSVVKSFLKNKMWNLYHNLAVQIQRSSLVFCRSAVPPIQMY